LAKTWTKKIEVREREALLLTADRIDDATYEEE
jgi:hypothetical protein